MVKLVENFVDFNKNTEYTIVEEGYDWVKIKHKGHVYYINKYLVNNNYGELQSYEEILEQD